MESVNVLGARADRAIRGGEAEQVSGRSPDGGDVAHLSGVFRLLGDPTRARILYALREAGELCVCDLAEVAGTAEAAVSQALRLLRASGVVSGRRSGRNVFYRLADAQVRLLLDVTRPHIGDVAVVTGGIRGGGTR